MLNYYFCEKLLLFVPTTTSTPGMLYMTRMFHSVDYYEYNFFMPTTTRPSYVAMPTSGHPLSFFQCREYFPYFDNFLHDIGVKFRSRSLFDSISFAPYRRAPFTPTFADGGVQRSLAHDLPYFPCMAPPWLRATSHRSHQSHLTPTTPQW